MSQPKGREPRHWDGMFQPDGTESDIWPGDTVAVAGAVFVKNADDTYSFADSATEEKAKAS